MAFQRHMVRTPQKDDLSTNVLPAEDKSFCKGGCKAATLSKSRAVTVQLLPLISWPLERQDGDGRCLRGTDGPQPLLLKADPKTGGHHSLQRHSQTEGVLLR